MAISIGAKVTDLVVLIASHIHGVARGWRRHQSELHADILALWQLNGLLTVAEDDVEGAACGRREGGSEAVGAESPVDIDGHVAAGAESLDATLVPGLRTGGE